MCERDRGRSVGAVETRKKSTFSLWHDWFSLISEASIVLVFDLLMRR